MNPLGQLSNSEYTFEDYLNIIRKKIDIKLSNKEFIGNIKFEINIKDGHVMNMNMEYKESIKI